MTTVDIWLVDSALPEHMLNGLVDTLDPTERIRAASLDHARRAEFIAAHGAARAILGRMSATPPVDVRWRFGRNGKPDVEHTRVSLSRSGGIALIACTPNRAVGVDLQRVDWVAPARKAHRFFSEHETREVVEETGGQDVRYTQLLARKEALVKAKGGRLFPALRTPVLDPVVGRYRLRDLAAPPGFAAAVALAGTADFRVREHRWPEETPC